jgi:hypothetical protein
VSPSGSLVRDVAAGRFAAVPHLRGTILRKVVMGPGWQKMFDRKPPHVLGRVDGATFTPDPELAAHGC